MISLKQENQGFTIIELLIVIIVIGILATLIITTLGDIQRNDRNRNREAEVKEIHNRVEYYYGQKDHYPSLAQVNELAGFEGWRAENLRGLSQAMLQDPKGEDGVLVAEPAPGAYSYQVTPDGCDNSKEKLCESYTLTATYEGGGVYVQKSFN